MAFKGFKHDLTCTMGKGVFQYEPGVWYKEDEAECAHTGFHATYNPLDVLEYYNREDDRYFVVELRGNIDEDAVNSRISAPEICLRKEITKEQLIVAGIKFMIKNPKLPWSNVVKEDKGTAWNDYVIVRGENPIARGDEGSMLFLVKESAAGFEVGIYEVGQDVKPNTYITVEGEVQDE